MKREDIEEIQEGKKDEVEKLPEKKQKLEDKKRREKYRHLKFLQIRLMI
jgi:hypothetical protein